MNSLHQLDSIDTLISFIKGINCTKFNYLTFIHQRNSPHQVQLPYFYSSEKLSLCHKVRFSIHISLEPAGVPLGYFNRRQFDLKASIPLKVPSMDIDIRCSELYWYHTKVSIPVHLRRNLILLWWPIEVCRECRF